MITVFNRRHHNFSRIYFSTINKNTYFNPIFGLYLNLIFKWGGGIRPGWVQVQNESAKNDF